MSCNSKTMTNTLKNCYSSSLCQGEGAAKTHAAKTTHLSESKLWRMIRSFAGAVMASEN